MFRFAGHVGMLFAIAVCQPVIADDDASAESQKETDAEVTQYVADLSAKDFVTRETASKQLEKRGKAAVPALTTAALEGAPEVRGRAFAILRALFRSQDADTKASATDALKQISEKGIPGVSQQAARLLNPPQPVQRRGRAFGGAQIQVQFQAGGAGARRVSTKVVNGVKEIDAEENGRKVHITDDPRKGITVKVTKKDANGKEKTETFEAANADELKKKHPEAHKLYESYSKGGVGNVIQIGMPMQAFPFPFRPIPVKKVDAVNRKVGEAMKRLEKAAESDDPAGEIAAALKTLKEVQDELEKLKVVGPGPALPKIQIQKQKQNQ